MVKMDRGENRIIVNLPIEVILPLDRWKNDQGIGSRRQACAQIIILFLYNEGYLSDEHFHSIKQRTKIFRTDEEYIKELTSEQIVKTDKSIEKELKKLHDTKLKKTYHVVMNMNPSEWWEFKEEYKRRFIEALGENHPLTKVVLKKIEEYENKLQKKLI